MSGVLAGPSSDVKFRPEESSPVLYGAEDVLPLGAPFGYVAGSEEPPSRDFRPFGLRHAVEPTPSPVDLDGFEYDTGRQVGMIRHGETLVPLLRHTTGTTSTRTSDGHKQMDSDSDQRED